MQLLIINRTFNKNEAIFENEKVVKILEKIVHSYKIKTVEQDAKNIEIATDMLKNKEDIKKIIKYTGLKEKEIKLLGD